MSKDKEFDSDTDRYCEAVNVIMDELVKYIKIPEEMPNIIGELLDRYISQKIVDYLPQMVYNMSEESRKELADLLFKELKKK